MCVTLQKITHLILITPCETGGPITTSRSQMEKPRHRRTKSELYGGAGRWSPGSSPARDSSASSVHRRCLAARQGPWFPTSLAETTVSPSLFLRRQEELSRAIWKEQTNNSSMGFGILAERIKTQPTEALKMRTLIISYTAGSEGEPGPG